MDQSISDTVRYYDENAEPFIRQTVNADLSTLHSRFLSTLPHSARILDAGSGSGRDTLAFRALDHDVVAIDASIEMVKATRRIAGDPAIQSTFLEYRSNELFDGIWACASLLHVPRRDLGLTLAHLGEMLTQRGILFASFKIGQTEQTRNGRFFNDMDNALLRTIVDDVPHLAVQSTWETEDARPDRSERWINAFLMRENNG